MKNIQNRLRKIKMAKKILWERHALCFSENRIVGSVKVNFLSYCYRADKSTVFGMRGLWSLSINSGRGATLKYL